MELYDFLTVHSDAILTHTVQAMSKRELAHYERLGPGGAEQRLRELLDHIRQGARTHHLDPVIEYAERIGNERFESGFDFVEVQGAVSLLEESIWLRILDDYPKDDAVLALSLVATLFGATKDRLASTYLSRATKTHVASLDMQRLFGGTQNTGGGAQGPESSSNDLSQRLFRGTQNTGGGAQGPEGSGGNGPRSR